MHCTFSFLTNKALQKVIFIFRRPRSWRCSFTLTLHLRRSWIPHSWQPSHPALYCLPFTARPSPFLTCSPPGPTFLRLKPHSCPPLTWRCSVSPRLASPFCTHCSLQSCFSTLPLILTPSPLAKNVGPASCIILVNFRAKSKRFFSTWRMKWRSDWR